MGLSVWLMNIGSRQRKKNRDLGELAGLIAV
jgi:hypothetical protein